MGSSSQLEKMLGAAGRAAGGLVKQAVKAGNVSQILPTASVAQRRDLSVSPPQPPLLFPRAKLSPSSEPLLTFNLKMDSQRFSTLWRLRTVSPSSSWRLPSTWVKTPSEPLPWMVQRV